MKTVGGPLERNVVSCTPNGSQTIGIREFTTRHSSIIPRPLIFRFPFNFRIDGDALFVTNGRSFDGHSGGAFSNTNGGTAM